MSYWDTIELLKLVNREMQEAAKNSSQSIAFSVPCYFSGHSNERYFSYWLEPGKQKIYQVRWCLSKNDNSGKDASVQLTNTQGLALHLGTSE